MHIQASQMDVILAPRRTRSRIAIPLESMWKLFYQDTCDISDLVELTLYPLAPSCQVCTSSLTLLIFAAGVNSCLATMNPLSDFNFI